ncbi:MAG: hypothetical protein K8I30_00100, partial [Anaerolineae bacterium]|nr:hypothetical protein [Anaerolineae bacterium]
MTRSTWTNNPPDARRLPPQTIDHVSAMMTAVTQPINALLPIERTIYTALWLLIARASAPIVIRNLPYKPEILQAALDHLIAERLLWYDNAMRAVLQCPPFSALHTPH